MMSITLTSNDASRRRPCLTCRRQTDKDALVGQVFENDESTGQIVCARCLSEPGAVMADLRQRVDGYRAKAAQRGESTDNFVTVPTLDEWEHVMQAAHENYCQSVTGGSIH